MNKTLKIFLVCFSVILLVEGNIVAARQEPRLSFSQKVDIGGFKLYFQIMGDGSPPVVICAGLGDSSKSWTKIQQQVAEFTQSISYDRAGLGQSEPSPKPRNDIHVAQELHVLLKNAGIQPPYVLLGHSFGGMHILTFADLFPDEIAGLVLVDPKDGTTFDGWKADLKPEKYSQLFNGFESYFNTATDTIKSEWEALKQSIGHPQKLDKLPDVPVVLLTSTRLSDPEINMGLTPEVVESSLRIHKELLRQFTNHTHIITERSGHNIQFDEPELVVNAIRKIVDEVRINK